MRVVARVFGSVTFVDRNGTLRELPPGEPLNKVTKEPKFTDGYCPTELDGWERLRKTSVRKPLIPRLSSPSSLLGTALGNRGSRDTRPVDMDGRRFGWEAHHIIPATSQRARDARILGFRCRIHPNSAVNGVWLRGIRRREDKPAFLRLDEDDRARTLHSRTFAQPYYDEINALMRAQRTGRYGCDHDAAVTALEEADRRLQVGRIDIAP